MDTARLSWEPCCSAGNIADALYGASLIPNLKVLYLANQTFTGSLPDNHAAWKQLEILDLSNNHLSVCPPLLPTPCHSWDSVRLVGLCEICGSLWDSCIAITQSTGCTNKFPEPNL